MSTDSKLERCAEVLFDADQHTALEEVYRQSKEKLTWSNAPSRVRAQYIEKAKQRVKELGYSI